MLRAMPVVGAESALASVPSCTCPRFGGPRQMEIGPVTLRISILKNDRFSISGPWPARILIGQPNVSQIKQFDTAIFRTVPPPNRNTLQRVENWQLFTVMYWQLPKSAQASS